MINIKAVPLLAFWSHAVKLQTDDTPLSFEFETNNFDGVFQSGSCSSTTSKKTKTKKRKGVAKELHLPKIDLNAGVQTDDLALFLSAFGQSVSFQFHDGSPEVIIPKTFLLRADPYFSMMFNSEFTEAVTSTIFVPDGIPHASVQHMVNYLIAQNIPEWPKDENQRNSDGAPAFKRRYIQEEITVPTPPQPVTDISTNVLMSCLTLAHNFMVPKEQGDETQPNVDSLLRLISKMRCAFTIESYFLLIEEELISRVNLDNYTELSEFAETFNADTLLESCSQILQNELVRSAGEGDRDHLHRCIAMGASINKKNAEGFTPLAQAVRYAQAGIVSELLNLGASADLVTAGGFGSPTALYAGIAAWSPFKKVHDPNRGRIVPDPDWDNRFPPSEYDEIFSQIAGSLLDAGANFHGFPEAQHEAEAIKAYFASNLPQTYNVLESTRELERAVCGELEYAPQVHKWETEKRKQQQQKEVNEYYEREIASLIENGARVNSGSTHWIFYVGGNNKLMVALDTGVATSKIISCLIDAGIDVNYTATYEDRHEFFSNGVPQVYGTGRVWEHTPLSFAATKGYSDEILLQLIQAGATAPPTFMKIHETHRETAETKEEHVEARARLDRLIALHEAGNAPSDRCTNM